MDAGLGIAVFGFFGFLSFLAFLAINNRKNLSNNYLLSERNNQCKECGNKRDIVEIMQPDVEQQEDPTIEQTSGLEKFEIFHPNGTKAVEGYLLEGRIHGTRKSWNRRKEPTMICNFEYGLLHGSWERYFSSGQLKSHGVYERVDDCSVCVHQTRHFYENGNMKEVESYNTIGQRHGNQEFYKQNGTLIKTDVYEEGEFVRSVPIEGNDNG